MQLSDTNNPFGLVIYFSVNPLRRAIDRSGQQKGMTSKNKTKPEKLERFLYVDSREPDGFAIFDWRMPIGNPVL
jgi:hypothetical protein